MHIASTLISAAVGGAFGTGSGGAVVASGAKFHKEKNPKPLLMGAAGAAVFAAQMMNFGTYRRRLSARGGARTGTGVSRDERDPDRAVSAVR